MRMDENNDSSEKVQESNDNSSEEKPVEEPQDTGNDDAPEGKNDQTNETKEEEKPEEAKHDSQKAKDLLKDTQGVGKFFGIMFGIMIFSLILAALWDKIPVIKDSVHALLNPTAGMLLAWNLDWGFLILVLIISLLTTVIQKYATDQEAIKTLKAEQKAMQKEVRKFKHDPQKMMGMNKEALPLMFKIMELSMKGTIFTIIPFILLFRWFMDVFSVMGDPRFFGFFTWFWFYLIFVMIFSTILRKWMKVA